MSLKDSHMKKRLVSLKGQLEKKDWTAAFTAHGWGKEVMVSDCLEGGRRQELLEAPLCPKPSRSF